MEMDDYTGALRANMRNENIALKIDYKPLPYNPHFSKNQGYVVIIFFSDFEMVGTVLGTLFKI